MATDLPDEFDVIVLGTGLPESILAAACSRIGLKILHLDRNDYYCGNWASFNLQGIKKWQTEQQTAACYKTAVDREKLSTLLKEGERAVRLPETFPSVFNVKSEYHTGERPEEELSAVLSPTDAALTVTSSEDTEAFPVQEKSQTDIVPGQFDSASEDETETGSLQDKYASGEKAENLIKIENGALETKSDTTVSADDDAKTVYDATKTVNKEPSFKERKQKDWFADDLEKEWRRFNLDLSPKLLYCAGPMVELLIASDVAKYCEFRTVSRVLTLRDNKLEKVPCSRADVFGSKVMSLPEKRLLMKFLTFAADYTQHSEEYEEYKSKPFEEFLTYKNLSPKIQHFVLHAIAMVTSSTPTEQGLANTQKFLQSLGWYGNTAFLFPLYGSGEIPQGFCRLSAVFGGCYCLTLSASDIIINSENRCTAVITSGGQRIDCKYLIADPSYMPADFYNFSPKRHISRGVFVTNKSVFPGEEEELSIMQLPHCDNHTASLVTVLELPPSAMVCPQGLYVVHMTQKTCVDAKSDLQPAVSSLFQTDSGATADILEKPRVLLSLYFQLLDLSEITHTEHMPSNMFVVTGPGSEYDLDRCVNETKNIFKQICPDEDFLPRPPHPDDIIYVDDEETPVLGEKSSGTSADLDTDETKCVDENESNVKTDETCALTEQCCDTSAGGVAGTPVISAETKEVIEEESQSKAHDASVLEM